MVKKATSKTAAKSATKAKAAPEPNSNPLPTSWLVVFAGIFVLIGLVGFYASDDQVTRVSEEAYVDERPTTQTFESMESEGPRIRIINDSE